MKHFFVLIPLLYLADITYSQKQSLNHSIYDDWPSIKNQKISNDGNYVVYSTETEKRGSTLIIQSINGSYKKEIPSAINPTITNDSRKVIFSMPGDSIGILEFGMDSFQIMTSISSFKIPTNGNVVWVAYQRAKINKDVILCNLTTGEQTSYANVTDYYFSDNGNVLLLQSISKSGSNMPDMALVWVSLPDKSTDTVMHGKAKAIRIVFDKMERQLAFISEEESEGKKIKTLRYYTPGMSIGKILVGGYTIGTKEDLVITSNGLFKFSKDGSKIFFSLVRNPELKTHIKRNLSDPPGVNIWSYDQPLQSLQLKGLIPNYLNPVFTAVLYVNENKVVCLNCQNNDDWRVELADEGDKDYVLVNTKSNVWEKDWNLSERPTVYLVSTKDGSRQLVKERLLASASEPVFSPKGKYVIWYDRQLRNYFTYNISSGVIKNITRLISVPLYDDEDDRPGAPFAFGIASWLENDLAVIIYDRYDVWQVDPEGNKIPINITESYGRKNKIVFRCIWPSEDHSPSPAVKYNELLLFSAFNRINKHNGFFQKKLSAKGFPEQLTMGPFIYYYPLHSYDIRSVLPLKAKNAEMYVVQRMNSVEAPNIFTTRDFRNFIKLSEIAPQKDYNWMTTELIHWKMFDGEIGEGLLYKPENFDPQKKYPVIFYFYEKNADALNNFIGVVPSNGAMNIPFFVSNGYVVFDPNIYYKVGNPGESVYNSVVSAARYLSKIPWVDSNRMGLQGISWGGYEVNYLITRTKIFAAAASTAGLSDLVSGYGGLSDNGHSLKDKYENGQVRIGATLWQRPELYIKNSPIFKADRVQTPLLIMHNQEDGAVPWQQAVEWFTALRRLAKKVWLLQYDGEDHGLYQSKNKLDYSIRLSQFFDHYLKGVAAPRWMTDGIPARLKGIDLRLDLMNKK